ncbi:MAG: prepilin-type N-terminal cleavage/methylation domain-containing protein [Patescibacteria group bacterium]
MNKHKRHYLSGFTLIETIVYIAIVSVFLVAIMSFSQRVISAQTKADTMAEVQQNARFALEKMSQKIRSARNINAESALDTNLVSGGLLHLDKNDSADDVYWQVIDGQLTERIGATGTEQTLTNDLITVQNLTFFEIQNSTNQSGLKIEFQVSFNNPNNWQEFDWDITLNDTVMFRQP